MKILLLLISLLVVLAKCRLCSQEVIHDMNIPTCDSNVWEDIQCMTLSNKIYCSAPCRSRQTQGNNFTHVACSKVNKKNKNCTKCRGLSGQMSCSGSTSYCNSHSCTSSSDCFCDLQTYNVEEECQVLGQWIKPIPTTVKLAVLKKEFIQFAGSSNPFNIYTEGGITRSTNRQLTTVSFEKPKVYVVTPEFKWTRVSINKDGLNKIHDCTATDCVIEVEHKYFINPGELEVIVYINSTVDAQHKFDISIQTRCDIPNCIFCSAMYHDFYCYPWQFKVFLITMIILSASSFFVAMFLLVKALKGVGCIAKTIGCLACIFCRCKKKKSEDGNPLYVEEVYDSESIDMEEVIELNVRPSKKSKGKSSRKITKGTAIALILALGLGLAMAAPCSSGIRVSSTFTDCTINGTVKSCSVSISELLSIPSPGLASCLTVFDDKEEYLGEIEVTYVHMLEVAPLQTQYYTAAWNGIAFSERNCPWEHMCGSCSAYNPLADPSAGGLIPALFLQFPGLSRCDSQCGCAGCGCFACDSSCVYSRASIVPNTDDIASVSRPISIHLRPRIRLNFTANGASEIKEIDIIASTQGLGDYFNVRMEGSLSGSSTVFAGQKVVSANGYATLGAASEPNAPVAGSVGDIQAGHPFQLYAGGSFNYAAGLFTVLPTTYSTNYQFRGAGIGARAGHDVLPTVRGDTLWDLSYPNLVGINSSPGAILFTLMTKEAFSFHRSIYVVCPVIENTTLVGCHSCDQAATLIIRARSRCSPGPASIILTGTLTPISMSVVLTTEFQDIRLRVHSGSLDNGGTIKLKSGDHEDIGLYTGVLYPENIIVVLNDTFIGTGNETNGGFVINFADWFDGIADWAKGLLMAGIAIAAIAAIIVGIILTLKGVRAYKAAKVKATYDNLTTQEQQRVIEEKALNNLSIKDLNDFN